MLACRAQALELEDLPEDDEEDIDFTLDDLLGPIESDAEDIAPEPEVPMSHGKSAVKSRRRTGRQDQTRWGI